MTEPSPVPTPRQIARQLNRLRGGQAVKFAQKQRVADNINSKQAARAKAPRMAKDWGSTETPAAYSGNFSMQIPPMNVTKGDVARFIFMPQIGNSLKSVGFSLAVIMQTFAVILIAARLLPADHPARTLEGAKRYHLLNLLGEARRNLKFTRAALPQWAIFTSVCGFIVSFSSILMLMLAKFGFGVALAYAAGGDPAGSTAGATNGAVLTGSMLTGTGDIASNMLDVIFNLNNISKTMPAINTLLSMYSKIMLIFAGVILLWVVISTIADTARTGVPFGKHFNPVWAPIRLVVAIGLLVPLGSGLSSGQHIVLSLAKWGSGQATNVWSTFAQKIDAGQGALTSAGSLNQSQENTRVMEEFIAQVTAELQTRVAIKTGDASYLPYQQVAGNANVTNKNNDIITTYPSVSVLCNSNIGSGYLSCGGWQYTTTDHIAGDLMASPNQAKSSVSPDTNSKDVSEPLLAMHYNTNQTLHDNIANSNLVQAVADMVTDTNPNYFKTTLTKQDVQNKLKQLQDSYFYDRITKTEDALSHYNTSIAQTIKDQVSKNGWMAAPIWINSIAQNNSTFITAKNAVPVFNFPYPEDPYVAQQLIAAMTIIGYQDPKSLNQLMQGGAASADDFRNLKGLFDNDGKPIENPIAHLTTLGRQATTLAAKLNDANALTDMGGKLPSSYDMSVGALQKFQKKYDDALHPKDAIAKVMAPDTIKGLRSATMPLSIFGFLLGYMLPLMPFFRFILGVLGWLLLVFEALLAMPLFALAHLKTDGEGFMSQMAQSGYIMILGLIIRPILMIIGMVVGLICFNAMAQLTNQLFLYAITNVNLNNGQMTNNMDPISLSINMMLYATFMITLANSAFKAIDLIPNHVMGWLGSRMDSRVDDSSMIQQNVMSGVMAGSGGAGFARGQAMGMPMGMKVGGGDAALNTQGADKTTASNTLTSDRPS